MAKHFQFQSKDEQDFDDEALLEFFRRAMREDFKNQKKTRFVRDEARAAEVMNYLRYLEGICVQNKLDPEKCITAARRELAPGTVDVTFSAKQFDIADLAALQAGIGGANVVAFGVANRKAELYATFEGVFRREVVEE